jgi:signal transduction histidine kinase/ligand-binding sensor domain-containing protein
MPFKNPTSDLLHVSSRFARCFVRTGLGLLVSLAVFWFAGDTALAGKQFHVHGWHVEDGLPDGSITALAETPDGYLWVGTRKGLVRFDGARFSRAGSDRPDGLSDQRVSGLLAARDGSLWVISERGAIMQYVAGQFKSRFISREMFSALKGSVRTGLDALENPSENQSWQSVSLLARDAADQVWALPNNSTLLRFSSSGEPLTVPTNGLPNGGLLGVCSDSAGQIWLGKGTNLCLFRDGQWSAFPIREEVRSEQLLLCRGSQEGIWVASTSGGGEEKVLCHRTVEKWVTPPIVATRNTLSAILQDHQGRLWASEWWGGVKVRLPDLNGNWQQAQEQGPLAKCVVTSLFEDLQGAIWVGTIGEGLHQITQPKVEMVMLPAEASSAALTSICPAEDGQLWLGTAGKGVYQWANGHMAHFGLADGLPSEGVDSLAQDARGHIWASTGSGLAVFRGERFVPVPELGGSALALFSDRAGNLWLGQQSKLLCLQGGTNATAYYAPDQRYLDIRNVAEDRDGRIWLAVFRSGVWQVQGTNLVPMNSQIGLPRLDVRSLLCDRDGTLWIGTLFGGLFRWDGQKLQHYLMVDGLPDDSIIGIAKDEKENLWISSGNGIFGCSCRQLADYERGHSPKLSCWQLGAADGLANRGCSGGGQPVIVRAADGPFWVANMVGAAKFDPAVVTREESPTNILVEAVLSDGVERHPQNSEYRFSTSARRFEFRYTAPELGSPKLLRFRHRLEGLDQDWVDAGGERSASYSKLVGGEYHFQVMVSGGDGVWRESREKLTLVVMPHLWERRSVQLAAVVLFMAAIFGRVLWNQRRKLKLRLERLEMLHAVEKERSRIARDIHDQLGASLTQIAIMSETPLAGATEPVTSQFNRIANKARAVVQNLNEIVWAVNPLNDNLPKLLDYVCSMSAELCESAGLRCWHDVPTGLPPTPLKVHFRHNLALAVREAINNAIKHAHASHVWIRVALTENQLLVEVEDDGRGFDVEQWREAGNGLRNIQTRLEQIGGRAEVTSQPGHGTKVTFRASLARS